MIKRLTRLRKGVHDKEIARQTDSIQSARRGAVVTNNGAGISMGILRIAYKIALALVEAGYQEEDHTTDSIINNSKKKIIMEPLTMYFIWTVRNPDNAGGINY